MCDNLGQAIPTPPHIDRRDIIIPYIPLSAYRLLIDFLKFDSGFCNYAIPHFHDAGGVTIYLAHETESQSSERSCPGAAEKRKN